MESDQWFTNAVGVIETRLAPEQLLENMLQVELTMGRDRSQGADRTVDLDILYYDDLISCSASLSLPHPDLHNRLFVLAPLEELAPDHLHPVQRQTTAQMRRSSAGFGQAVKKISWEEK